MAQAIREDAQFSQDDDIDISYLGEYIADGRSLRWFQVQAQGRTLSYKAVECQSLAGGWSLVKNIYDAKAYAPDIVHVLWQGNDIFLMNNPNCTSLVYKDTSGGVITTTEFPSTDLPYIFPYQSVNGTADFLDAGGNPIPY